MFALHNQSWLCPKQSRTNSSKLSPISHQTYCENNDFVELKVRGSELGLETYVLGQMWKDGCSDGCFWTYLVEAL